MATWTTNPIVFFMACRRVIQEVGIHDLESLHVVLTIVRDCLRYGKPNYTKANWVMLTGTDVAVRNAIHVQKNASAGVVS